MSRIIFIIIIYLFANPIKTVDTDNVHIIFKSKLHAMRY